MAALQYSKSKIQLAKADYERKLQRPAEALAASFSRSCPERVILLSDTLEVPTLDNLWNYLSHFYDKVTPALKEQFSFEDLAGIYTENGISRLFAVCIRYAEHRRVEGIAKGKIPVRELHGREPRANAARADAHSPNRIWRRAGIYGTAHCCIRYFALEL